MEVTCASTFIRAGFTVGTYMKNDGLSEEAAIKKTIELLNYALVVQKKTEPNKQQMNKLTNFTLPRNIHPNPDIEL